MGGHDGPKYAISRIQFATPLIIVQLFEQLDAQFRFDVSLAKREHGIRCDADGPTDASARLCWMVGNAPNDFTLFVYGYAQEWVSRLDPGGLAGVEKPTSATDRS